MNQRREATTKCHFTKKTKEVSHNNSDEEVVVETRKLKVKEEKAYITNIRRYGKSGKKIGSPVYYKFEIEWSEVIDGRKIHTFYFLNGEKIDDPKIEDFEPLFFDYADFKIIASFYHVYFPDINIYLKKEISKITYWERREGTTICYVIKCGKHFQVSFHIDFNHEGSLIYDGTFYKIGNPESYEQLSGKELLDAKTLFFKNCDIFDHIDKIYTILSEEDQEKLLKEKCIVSNELIFTNCATTLFENNSEEEVRSTSSVYEVEFTNLKFVISFIFDSILEDL